MSDAIASAIRDFDMECPRLIEQGLDQITKEHMKYCAFPHRLVRKVAKVSQERMREQCAQEAHYDYSTDPSGRIAAMPLEGVEDDAPTFNQVRKSYGQD